MTHGRDDLGQRSETAHRGNLSAILRALHESGPLSRSELVARTGLTRSAIRGLVGELESAGLVVEDGHVHLGTPGRPSPRVRVDPPCPCREQLDALACRRPAQPDLEPLGSSPNGA